MGCTGAKPRRIQKAEQNVSQTFKNEEEEATRKVENKVESANVTNPEVNRVAAVEKAIEDEDVVKTEEDVDFNLKIKRMDLEVAVDK